MVTKSEEFQPQLLTCGKPESGKYGELYYPICYDRQRLQTTTGKCFSWGLQKDMKGSGYNLPIVLGERGEVLPRQEEFCKFLESVARIARKSVTPNLDKDPKGMLSCVYVKTEVPTLYAKVGHNPATGWFHTKFFEAGAVGNKVKCLNPEEIMGRRCTVNAVICPESVFVSGDHATIQVKFTQVLMKFDEVEEQVIETLVEEW